MGIWGVKIFQNDLAEDIRELYKELIENEENHVKVTKEIIEQYKENLEKEEISVFWFALASIQMEYGVLLERVKKKALYYLESKKDTERWKTESTKEDYNERKEELELLKKSIICFEPKKKKGIRKKRYICPWNIGDVYAYKMKEDGKYIVFIKIEEGEYFKNICPIVYVYNKIFNYLPNAEELKHIKYLPQLVYPGRKDIVYKCMLGIEEETEYYAKKCVYITNIKKYDIPKDEINDIIKLNNSVIRLIEKFEEKEIKSYQKWKNIFY